MALTNQDALGEGGMKRRSRSTKAATPAAAQPAPTPQAMDRSMSADATGLQSPPVGGAVGVPSASVAADGCVNGTGAGVVFRGSPCEASTPGGDGVGAGGQGAAGDPVARKVPAWLKINGKGAQARALANGGIPAWMTGRKRGTGVASAKGATRQDVDRVLGLVGVSADRGSQAHGAAKRALVAALVRSGLPARVFRSSIVRDAMASRWRRKMSPCEAVRRWTVAVLGKPVGIRALVRAFREYYGMPPTKTPTKGKAKGARYRNMGTHGTLRVSDGEPAPDGRKVATA